MLNHASEAEDALGGFESLLGHWQHPAIVATVRQARIDVDACLGALSIANRDDVVVVVSELVTNAVTHAVTEITVYVEQWQNAIRIIVEDACELLPQFAESSVDIDRVRGLHIVSDLSDRWGVEETASGKKVWATFARA